MLHTKWKANGKRLWFGLPDSVSQNENRETTWGETVKNQLLKTSAQIDPLEEVIQQYLRMSGLNAFPFLSFLWVNLLFNLFLHPSLSLSLYIYIYIYRERERGRRRVWERERHRYIYMRVCVCMCVSLCVFSSISFSFPFYVYLVFFLSFFPSFFLCLFVSFFIYLFDLSLPFFILELWISNMLAIIWHKRISAGIERERFCCVNLPAKELQFTGVLK